MWSIIRFRFDNLTLLKVIIQKCNNNNNNNETTSNAFLPNKPSLKRIPSTGSKMVI